MIDRMTFSIIAADLDALDGPEWGVAVASKFLAAGSVVPWAKAGAGAVATQALANVSYGPEGLDRLQKGEGAETVVEALTRPTRTPGRDRSGSSTPPAARPRSRAESALIGPVGRSVGASAVRATSSLGPR
jgi:hypothetical protein